MLLKKFSREKIKVSFRKVERTDSLVELGNRESKTIEALKKFLEESPSSVNYCSSGMQIGQAVGNLLGIESEFSVSGCLNSLEEVMEKKKALDNNGKKIDEEILNHGKKVESINEEQMKSIKDMKYNFYKNPLFLMGVGTVGIVIGVFGLSQAGQLMLMKAMVVQQGSVVKETVVPLSKEVMKDSNVSKTTFSVFQMSHEGPSVVSKIFDKVPEWFQKLWLRK